MSQHLTEQLTPSAVQLGMKNDNRTLTRKSLGAMRFMALERMAEGESPAAVSASFGMHRTWAYKGRLKARGRGKGKQAVRLPPRLRRKWTNAQEQQVFRWVNAQNPWQYGFDFGLWTLRIVGELIAQRFGVMLSLALVGALLARVGLTPQKPLQRAYQREPEVIARWRRETYPAIARQTKRDGADIYFWDEFGFQVLPYTARPGAQRGQTPVVDVPGQRPSISATSAVSAKEAFGFATDKGSLTGDLFATFLRRLMRGRRKPLHLILDNLPAHKTGAVNTYVARCKGKLTLHFLPGYAPELNPDELLWCHAKHTSNTRRTLRSGRTWANASPINSLTSASNRP